MSKNKYIFPRLTLEEAVDWSLVVVSAPSQFELNTMMTQLEGVAEATGRKLTQFEPGLAVLEDGYLYFHSYIGLEWSDVLHSVEALVPRSVPGAIFNAVSFEDEKFNIAYIEDRAGITNDIRSLRPSFIMDRFTCKEQADPVALKQSLSDAPALDVDSLSELKEPF